MITPPAKRLDRASPVSERSAAVSRWIAPAVVVAFVIGSVMFLLDRDKRLEREASHRRSAEIDKVLSAARGRAAEEAQREASAQAAADYQLLDPWCASVFCQFGAHDCEAMRDRLRVGTEPCRHVETVACFTGHTGAVMCYSDMEFCNRWRTADKNAPVTACRLARRFEDMPPLDALTAPMR